MSIMEYYYYLNGTQFGPVPMEAMRSRIDCSTLVWREGLDNWQPAGSLPELTPIFAQNVQPPIIQGGRLRDFSKTTKVFAIFGIILSSIMLLISIILLFSEPDRNWNYYYRYYYYGVDYRWGFFYFMLSFFLLVFSIITLVKSSNALRKKRQMGYR